MSKQGPLRRILAKLAKSYQETLSPMNSINDAWSTWREVYDHNRWTFRKFSESNILTSFLPKRQANKRLVRWPLYDKWGVDRGLVCEITTLLFVFKFVKLIYQVSRVYKDAKDQCFSIKIYKSTRYGISFTLGISFPKVFLQEDFKILKFKWDFY